MFLAWFPIGKVLQKNSRIALNSRMQNTRLRIYDEYTRLKNRLHNMDPNRVRVLTRCFGSLILIM